MAGTPPWRTKLGLVNSAQWCLGQAALHEAAGGDDPNGALSAACRRIDPLLRGHARKRASAALLDAELESSRAGHPEVAARLAWLELSGENTADLATTAARFTECYVSGPAPRWLISASVLLLIAAVCATILFVKLAPDYLLDSELQRPSARAFITGGRPLTGTPEQQAFFRADLARFVMELDRSRPGQRGFVSRKHRAAFLQDIREELVADAGTRLGPSSALALDELLGVTLDHCLRHAGQALAIYATAQAFNRTLEALGLGLQLEANVLGDRVLIASFLVEWVQHYRSGPRRLRALRRTRLDSLSFSRGVLGFTTDGEDDARVLMDRIDAWLVRAVLPALAPGKRLRLADDELRRYDLPWVSALERTAANHARRQLGALVDDPEDVAALGATIQQRAAMFARFNQQLGSRGVTVYPPEGYGLDPQRYTAIRPALLPQQWRELESIQLRLDHGDLAATWRTVRAALGRSVERHEIQHLLDGSSMVMPPLPAPLPDLLEPGDDTAISAMRELSAYLAELARGHQVIKLNLALLTRFLLNDNFWGTPECYATLAMFTSLARTRGLSHGPLVVGGSIDRQAVATLVTALMAVPDDVLAAQTGGLWRELFGRPLAPLAMED